MTLLVNALAVSALLLSGTAGLPPQGVSSTDGQPTTIVTSEGGDELLVTPEQCAIWKYTNPELYRKYCL